MGGLTWFLRMAQWARNPPSEGRVKLVVGVILLCLAIALYEWAFGWPDWLTTQGGARPVR
ncbi:MAG TPA: hypothetical protein VLA78_06080 [Paracoccaceae bacterium]|jgi:hypothetical protein|nr:hypothetical protein [Paracoccaceae bacterium]